MRLFTIGFTKKSAERFFTALTAAGVARVLDVRLNNSSQLAGFAKRDDLAYFLRVHGIGYAAVPELAPTADMLDAYKKLKGDWAAYEPRYVQLLRDRKVEDTVPRELVAGGCFLCSEDQPHHCHRRLAAEYLAAKWGGVEVVHLG